MVKTFDDIMNEMLAMISNSFDKREGSLIWSALAPTAAQLAEGYAYLDSYLDLLIADTAVGTYLERLCSLVGIERHEATSAVIIGEFRDFENKLVEINLGLNFSVSANVYTAVERLSTGRYLLKAKKGGTVGNVLSGLLLPVEYVDGLMNAEIKGIEVYGEDEESDESLRKRYLDYMRVPAFGGNVSDYEEKVLEFEGIGAVKVFPVCNGAGTVGIVVGSDIMRKVEESVTDYIAAEFNKVDENNMSCGLAPIGHFVYVKSAEEVKIDIKAKVAIQENTEYETVKNAVAEELEKYIGSIDFFDSVIHKSPIEMTVFSVDGVADVFDITVNGEANSLQLSKSYEKYQVPVFNSLVLEV